MIYLQSTAKIMTILLYFILKHRLYPEDTVETVSKLMKRRLNYDDISIFLFTKGRNMKKILIIVLVMVLLFISVSPGLAGHGKGSAGRGSGRAGQVNPGSGRGLSAYGNGGGKQTGNVITGIITEIEGDAESSLIFVLVYGGKDTSLYGKVVEVQTDSSTRFLLKDYGVIPFDQIKVDDPVSIAIGGDNIADRITVGADCPKIP